MVVYAPHCWVVVKISSKKTTQVGHKLFACWYGGGFVGSDSWKLNSGIVSVTKKNDRLDFLGHSGSIYSCGMGCYGTTSHGTGVLDTWIAECAHVATIERMSSETDFLNYDWK